MSKYKITSPTLESAVAKLAHKINEVLNPEWHDRWGVELGLAEALSEGGVIEDILVARVARFFSKLRDF